MATFELPPPRNQLWRGPSARLPHGYDHRNAYRRPGSARWHHHLHDVRRARLRGASRVRIRRYPPGAFGEGKCHEDTTDSGYKVWRWDDEVEDPAHDDSRWPVKCDQCEYLFKPEDSWQVFREVIFVNKDTGQEMTLRNCPPGAMWDADWYPEKGPDGKALCVALPPHGGDDSWHIDGYAKGGGKWSRTGTAPNITANPSILTPRYHGFLRAGYLEEC